MLKQLMNSGSLNALVLRSAEDESGAETEFAYDTQAFIDEFEADRERKFKATKAVLETAITNAGQTFDGWAEAEDSEAIFKFMEKVELAFAKVSITDPAISVLADTMNQDAEFTREVNECIEAVVKGKTTAVDIYGQFRRMFTKEQMDGMPFAGSDEKSVVGTNYKPDKVKTTDRVTGVEITTNWTNDLVSTTAFGKSWETDLDAIGKELKTANSSPIAKWKGLSKKDLTAQKRILEQKRNALRSMFKRAINTHHQFEAVAGMPEVEISWITVKKDGIIIPRNQHSDVDLKDGKTFIQITKSPKPLWIAPKGQPSDGRDFSITQLVNFNVPAALNGENGGTMGDLVATLSKGSDEPEDGEGTGEKMTPDDAVIAQQRWVSWMNNKDNRAELRRRLADKNNADRKDLLENVMAEFSHLLPIVRLYKAEWEAMTGGSPLPVELGGQPQAKAS